METTKEAGLNEKIISFVSEHPVLYDKGSRSYKNNSARNKLWAELANLLEMDVKALTTRWRTLRDRYAKERREIEVSQRSGAEPTDYTPWEYSDQMEFLKDHVSRRATLLFFQHALLMNDPAMIRANVIGLGISVVYAVFFYLYTPRQSKGAFWKQTGISGAVVAVLLGYAQIENPNVVEDRFGFIVTILMLLLIGQPLFGLPEIIRKKSTEGLPFPMILSGTVVGSLWLLYGIILNNVFMILQNLVAVSLSGVQLALFVIYPSKDSQKKKQ